MAEQQLLIPMAVGERLGKLRQEQRRTLESCAAAIKVQVETLADIEADRFHRFAPIYRKGYIVAYARHLGLDESEITAMLESVHEENPELKSVFEAPPPVRSGDRWLRAASYVLASLLIGTLAWQLTHEAVRLYQGAGKEQLADSGTAADSRGMSAPARPGHVNASIASLEDMGRNRAGTMGDPARAAWSALQPPESAPIVEELPEGHHRLRLETSGDSWIEIFDASGIQLEMDLVRGGAARDYQGEAPFRILFGRASAVTLYMDGRPVDLKAYTSGDVMQMSLDEGFAEDIQPVAEPTDG